MIMGTQKDQLMRRSLPVRGGCKPSPKARVMLLAAATMWAALAPSGCDATVEHRGSEAQDSSVAGGGGAAIAAPEIGCPTEQPDEGSPCATSTVCSFGDSLGMACRITMDCFLGEWHAWGEGCSPPGTHDCPAKVPGRLAPCAENGAICAYDAGTVCECSSCVCGLCGGSCGGDYTWTCKTPGPGCPTEFPNRGTPCDADGLVCHYGDPCGLSRGHAWCVDGLWNWEGTYDCDP